MTTPAYSLVQMRVYCGATPVYPTARLEITFFSDWPHEKWPDLLATSIAVVDQLMCSGVGLEMLGKAKPSAIAQGNPLLVWSGALWTHLGVPDYPVHIEYIPDGNVRIQITCPYLEAVQTAFNLIASLLNLSAEVMLKRPFQLEMGSFMQQVTRLPHLLPGPSVMGMHAALGAQHTDWEWLGGDLTRVGQGRSQRLCLGFNSANASLASAAAMQNDTVRSHLLRTAGFAVYDKNRVPRAAFDLLIIEGQLCAAVTSQSDSCGREKFQVAGAVEIQKMVHPELAVACARVFRLFNMPLLALTYHADSLAEDPAAIGGTFSAVRYDTDLLMFSADPSSYLSLVSEVTATLFPAEELRVPIYTVTGSVGKTTTVRLLGQLLTASGLKLGLTSSDGAWVGEHRWLEGDCIGGVSAQAILRHPDVEVAVLELGRGGMVNQGIPFKYSDVAVLLNVQAVHLGLDGIDTLEAMADTKSLSLTRARLAVLNHDDEQCRRLGEQRKPESCVWFSLTAAVDDLSRLSQKARGAVGVARGAGGEALALDVWQDCAMIRQFPLSGVAPFHGTLGEKTIEELLAAVAAAWFGPVEIADWATLLPLLQLNSENHLFRCSIHRQGNIVFVLDKAGEMASLSVLESVLDEITQREGIQRRLGVLCRSAGEPPDRHRESCASCYPFLDEFICFDRPDTYTGNSALPIYAPGSIPQLLQQELQRLNQESNCNKPVHVLEDWAAVATYLRENLQLEGQKILVLINQPSTSAGELNQNIADFVNGFYAQS